MIRSAPGKPSPKVPPVEWWSLRADFRSLNPGPSSTALISTALAPSLRSSTQLTKIYPRPPPYLRILRPSSEATVAIPATSTALKALCSKGFVWRLSTAIFRSTSSRISNRLTVARRDLPGEIYFAGMLRFKLLFLAEIRAFGLTPERLLGATLAYDHLSRCRSDQEVSGICQPP